MPTKFQVTVEVDTVESGETAQVTADNLQGLLSDALEGTDDGEDEYGVAFHVSSITDVRTVS